MWSLMSLYTFRDCSLVWSASTDISRSFLKNLNSFWTTGRCWHCEMLWAMPVLTVANRCFIIVSIMAADKLFIAFARAGYCFVMDSGFLQKCWEMLKSPDYFCLWSYFTDCFLCSLLCCTICSAKASIIRWTNSSDSRKLFSYQFQPGRLSPGALPCTLRYQGNSKMAVEMKHTLHILSPEVV